MTKHNYTIRIIIVTDDLKIIVVCYFLLYCLSCFMLFYNHGKQLMLVVQTVWENNGIRNR